MTYLAFSSSDATLPTLPLLDLPPRLTAQPDEVARAISDAVARGRDVVYVRPVWRLVMAIIRGLPERAFKRTRI